MSKPKYTMAAYHEDYKLPLLVNNYDDSGELMVDVDAFLKKPKIDHLRISMYEDPSNPDTGEE